jgi:hypothetical protein
MFEELHRGVRRIARSPRTAAFAELSLTLTTLAD